MGMKSRSKTAKRNIEMAVSRRIDAVWTIVFTRIEGGVKILAHSRNIREGYEREKELPLGDLLETKERIATGLVLAPYAPFQSWPTEDTIVETLPVVNQAHVFDYGDTW